MSQKNIQNKNTIPLTETAFLRLPQILNVMPVSRSSWLRGVASGFYPQPVKLGVRTVGWKAGDIRLLIEKLGEVA